ncbi:MAG: PH domain-containing protein [Ectobacillus sp.]
MYSARRLHPAAILLTIGKYSWNLFPLYTIVLFKYSGSLPFTTIINTALLLCLFLAVISAGAVVHWRRFIYSIYEEQLIIEYGLFTCKKRYIPKERVQALHESEDIIHRLFGLVKLQIDTAGGSGPEVVLRAVTKEEAVQIMKLLSHYKETGQAAGETVPFSDYTFQLSKRRLFLYAATSGSIGIVFSALAGLYFEIDDFFHLTFQINDLFGKTASFYAAGLLILALIVWIAGILIVYQKYYGFKVVRQQEDLIITKGLFEKQKLTIPLGRIQAIKIEENIIRQWLNVASVRLVSAGGKEDESAELSLICFPLVRKTELSFIFKHFLPGFSIGSSLCSLPRRACKRYIVCVFLPISIVSLLALSYIPFATYFVPFMVLASIWLGYRQYKDAGWEINGQQLTVAFRRLGRITVLIKRSRIQSLSVSKTVLQESASLCTVKVYAKSGFSHTAFPLRDADEGAGVLLRQWYSYGQAAEMHSYADVNT